MKQAARQQTSQPPAPSASAGLALRPEHSERPVLSERDDVEAYYRTIAPFYDAEQASRDDLGFWRAVGAQHQGGRFLELGAGSGLVTAELALSAAELAAIDLSPELLRLARPRVAQFRGVHLLLADMLALPFRRSRRRLVDGPFDGPSNGLSVGPTNGLFDLIVAANDPLSHLIADADRDRALAEVARHLAPGGRFVLDALWLAPNEAAAVARSGGRVRGHTATVHGEQLRVVERWERPRGRGRCCLAHYEYHRADHLPVVADFEARDWSPDELFGRFERAGLGVAQLWGGYHGEAWHPLRSSQLIVEATLASR